MAEVAKADAKVLAEPKFVELKKPIGKIKVDKSLFDKYIDSEYGYDLLKLTNSIDFDLIHSGTNTVVSITKDDKGIINIFAENADISIGSGNNKTDRMKVNCKNSEIRLYSENNDDINVGDYDKNSIINIRYLNGPEVKIGNKEQPNY